KNRIMRRILILLCVGLSIFTVASGQELLSVKQAVEIALENNYDIRLAQNERHIARENKTYGNAGMLPTATADLAQSNSVQNATQVQNTGVERSLDNARNHNLTYGVSIGWTIFDGLGMFARYEKLQELEKQGDLQLKRTVLSTVGDVITLYYTIV